jgi:enoyl-CoA hydratase/carnithine racemase
VTAADALAFGMVDRLVATPAELLPVAGPLAATLPTRSGVAVAALKRALREGLERPLVDGLALEVELMESVAASDDATEGYRAFLEKRPPRFSHR